MSAHRLHRPRMACKHSSTSHHSRPTRPTCVPRITSERQPGGGGDQRVDGEGPAVDQVSLLCTFVVAVRAHLRSLCMRRCTIRRLTPCVSASHPCCTSIDGWTAPCNVRVSERAAPGRLRTWCSPRRLDSGGSGGGVRTRADDGSVEMGGENKGGRPAGCVAPRIPL